MLLYVGDIHAWHTTPRSRTDNYRESSLLMLEKVGRLATDLQVEAILLGGDVGHDTDWPISLVHEVADVMLKWPAPIYTAVGNHDMDNYCLETHKRSGLGALARMGVLEIGYLVEIGQDWRVEFFHAGQEKSKRLVAGGWSPGREKDGRTEVAVAHVPVGPNAAGKHIIPYKQLVVDPVYDLLCLADIHMKFGPHTLITGCQVINPGPLERRSVDEKNEGGYVAILHADKRVELIDLGAPSAEQVFVALKAETEMAEILGESLLEDMQKMRSDPLKPLDEQIVEMGELLGFDERPVNRLLEEILSGAQKS